MPTDHRRELAKISSFTQLVAYLCDKMDWPIARDSFDDVDDLFYDFTPEELGIDENNAAKIQQIKRLRPLSVHQPFGIFFIKFEPKRLPVVALRRILSRVALKNRASANSDERAAWSADDLLFVSNYGSGDSRQISFAHFSQSAVKKDLPTLKVLGWDSLDTELHLDYVSEKLTQLLAWPDDEEDAEKWRKQWRSAFTLGHREAINTSKKLSVELAKLARNIRDRINTVLAIETEDGPVSKLMAAFKEALVHDLDEDGFADMYAQTIAYGLLSARVTNPSGDTADDFAEAMPVTNPFLKELMETFLHVGGRNGSAAGAAGLDFDELGVSEVVELLDAAKMEAVIRDFGDRNPQKDPVIHFYELFLKEYDARKRMQRGVFYTPRPVVSYIVRSVDELLRTKFGLKYGLADITTWREISSRIENLEIPAGTSPEQTFVQILDPATGTGTFLVEVIGIVYETMIQKWQSDGHNSNKIQKRWNNYVSEQLLPRLHGYELMMAPYAIAHMKIGLKLYETGYLFGSDERARVYLTNSLEPPHDFSDTLAFAIPALAHEAESVNKIKRDQRFTVVIGNPPYSKASQNLGEQFQYLIEDFRSFCGEQIREPGAILFERDINNDYIKFLGSARHIINVADAGVVGMITSSSYLDGKNFRGVRDALSATFDEISVLNLHGDRRSGALARDNVVDENVFDIETGVSVLFATKMPGSSTCSETMYSDVSGTFEEKSDLLMAREPRIDWVSQPIDPRRYKSFLSSDSIRLDEYADYSRLDEMFGLAVDGIKTSRDGLVIANSREECSSRIRDFMNFRGSSEEIRERFNISVAKWNFAAAQKHLQQSFSEDHIHRIAYRPMDFRYIYYDSNIVFSHRMKKMYHLLHDENLALVCASRLSSNGFNHILPADCLVEMKYASHDTNSRAFPTILHDESLLGSEARPNVGEAATKLAGQDMASSEWSELCLAALAFMNSPKYRKRFFAEIKNDFPGIPPLVDSQLRRNLAEQGQRILNAQLLRADVPENEFPFVGQVEGPITTPKLEDGVLKISGSGHFAGVDEKVFQFNMAGYQVCKTWVSAGNRCGIQRKGETLSFKHVHTYRQVLFGITETLAAREHIDSILADQLGW